MQISKTKGFPLLWLLVKEHHLTEMCYPTTLFLADKALVEGAICKKQPCSTLLQPLTKKIMHCIIIKELSTFCNPEQLWTQIWRCQCYLLLLYNSHSYAYSYLSQCKNTYKTQYPSTPLHRPRSWVQNLTRANVELAAINNRRVCIKCWAILYTQKTTFYHLRRDCQSKRKINASYTSYQFFQGIPQARSTWKLVCVLAPLWRGLSWSSLGWWERWQYHTVFVPLLTREGRSR